MSSLSVRRTVLVVTAVTGAVLVACGREDDKEPLTLAGYVQTFVSLDQTYEGRAEPLRERLDAELNGLPESAVVPADVFDTFQELADEDARFTDEIAALDPPGEAQGLHGEVVIARRSDHDAIQAVLNRVSEVTTVAELHQMLTAPAVMDAEHRKGEACAAVQDLVNGQGVSVDLGC